MAPQIPTPTPKIVQQANRYQIHVLVAYRPGYPNRTSSGEDDRVDVDTQPHLVEIVAALKEITARISTATSLSAAIDDLVKVAVDILPADIQCGVTLVSQGGPATFASSAVPA